jgi:hypothetical protein
MSQIAVELVLEVPSPYALAASTIACVTRTTTTRMELFAAREAHHHEDASRWG